MKTDATAYKNTLQQIIEMIADSVMYMMFFFAELTSPEVLF